MNSRLLQEVIEDFCNTSVKGDKEVKKSNLLKLSLANKGYDLVECNLVATSKDKYSYTHRLAVSFVVNNPTSKERAGITLVGMMQDEIEAIRLITLRLHKFFNEELLSSLRRIHKALDELTEKDDVVFTLFNEFCTKVKITYKEGKLMLHVNNAKFDMERKTLSWTTKGVLKSYIKHNFDFCLSLDVDMNTTRYMS